MGLDHLFLKTFLVQICCTISNTPNYAARPASHTHNNTLSRAPVVKRLITLFYLAPKYFLILGTNIIFRFFLKRVNSEFKNLRILNLLKVFFFF